MSAMRQALILLAVTSVALSQSLPFGCEWSNTLCPPGKVINATCDCGCPGIVLCCNESLKTRYLDTRWVISQPLCTGTCDDCDGDECWYLDTCDNGITCETGYIRALCSHNRFPDVSLGLWLCLLLVPE